MLEQLRRQGHHAVIDWPCIGDQDYAAGLRAVWNGERSVCVLEQDLEPSPRDLLLLEQCRELVCTQAYQLHRPTTGTRDSCWSFRNYSAAGAPTWGAEGDAWADYFGLGCTAFKPAAMALVPKVPDVPWRELDHQLASVFYAAAVRVHVHWPAIPHRHH